MRPAYPGNAVAANPVGSGTIVAEIEAVRQSGARFRHGVALAPIANARFA